MMTEETFLRNKKAGYHATVYIDPSSNARRDTSDALFKVMPTRKCKARDGDPLARVFKGAREVEVITDYDERLQNRYTE
ncbi:hypothetical protein [Lacticaseibacillus saniviri]|uniref:hypothetical protein n=1 Tax=Lacticaseibacillus saniviri TaxID=931533 RepID=UPI0006D1939F|nr:hypothetical protein [Lacticaseibacillus saniviri]